jgi:hypothetical protein
MVVDGFGSSFGLVWIIGSSLLVSSLVLCGQQILSSVGNNSCPLWATTLVLYGITTLVLCVQQLLSSVGNNPCPLWATTLVLYGTTTLVLYEQQPLSSVGNNPCPLWDTPPSVVTFLFNWLVWSVGQILG